MAGIEVEEKIDEDFVEEESIEKSTLAHDLNKKPRSADVIVEGRDSELDFTGLQLTEEVMKGLKSCGFEKPSPIQVRAIPLGRLGFDLLLQAKSGTGKTCVFSVITLESVHLPTEKIQALVLCPSREIAYQSKYVIKSIGAFRSGLKVKTFIGGKPLDKESRRMKGCHIALGTPGRIAHLIREYEMDLSAVRVFVLDEADKLLDDSFFADLKYIYDAMPASRQVLAVSATYPNDLDHFILRFMNTPIKVQLDTTAPVLLAVEQFALDVRRVLEFVPEPDQSVKMEDISKLKLRCLLELVRRVPFSQGIVFSQYQLKAERVYDELRYAGIDVVLMSGAMSQKLRLESLDQFQQGKCRLMVATDLVARGIDCESVDLVINFECPQDISTYIHRMGRAGRFGSFGSVVTFLGFPNERAQILRFQSQVNLCISLVTTFKGLDSIGHQTPSDVQLGKLCGKRSGTGPSNETDSMAITPTEALVLSLHYKKSDRMKTSIGWGATISMEDALKCLDDDFPELEIAMQKMEKAGAEGNPDSFQQVSGDADPEGTDSGVQLNSDTEYNQPGTSHYTFTSQILRAKNSGVDVAVAGSSEVASTKVPIIEGQEQVLSIPAGLGGGDGISLSEDLKKPSPPTRARAREDDYDWDSDQVASRSGSEESSSED